MTGSNKVNNDIEARLIENNETIKKTIADASGTIGAEGDILIMGVITASGKLKLCDSTAVDGSAVPRYAVLGPVVANGADVTRRVVCWGKINAAHVVFGGTDTIDTKVSDVSHFDNLRAAGILAVTYDNLN